MIYGNKSSSNRGIEFTGKIRETRKEEEKKSPEKLSQSLNFNKKERYEQ